MYGSPTYVPWLLVIVQFVMLIECMLYIYNLCTYLSVKEPLLYLAVNIEKLGTQLDIIVYQNYR